jgi:hypothetical protein
LCEGIVPVVFIGASKLEITKMIYGF